MSSRLILRLQDTPSFIDTKEDRKSQPGSLRKPIETNGPSQQHHTSNTGMIGLGQTYTLDHCEGATHNEDRSKDTTHLIMTWIGFLSTCQDFVFLDSVFCPLPGHHILPTIPTKAHTSPSIVSRLLYYQGQPLNLLRAPGCRSPKTPYGPPQSGTRLWG